MGAAAFEAWRRRRARLVQFYLNELLVFVTLAAVLLSWLSVEIRESREEQEAVRKMTGISYTQTLTGPALGVPIRPVGAFRGLRPRRFTFH